MRKIIHRYTVLLLTVLLVGTGIALADTDVIVLGDVNSDGSVNTADVTALVNYLHGSGTVDVVAADVNRDGAIDIADVTAINNIISSGTFDKGTASTLFFPAATVNKTYGDAAFKNQLVRSGSTGAITYTSSATGVATVNTTTGEVTIQGAGTATITATLAANGGISGTTASYTVYVAKVAAGTDPSTTMTTSVFAKKDGENNQSYTGGALPLVTAGVSSAGTVYYKVTPTNEKPTSTEGFSASVPTATDAGTYYVWYYAGGNDNYNETAISGTSIEVVIDKATPVYTAPAFSALTYTGGAQNLVSAGVSSHGTFTYSTSENGTYTEDVPQGTAAGNYTVWYKFTGDANHKDVVATEVTGITIAKAPSTTDPSSTMTTSVTAKKDGENNQSYTGGALPLVTAGVSSAGTVYYKVTTTDEKPTSTEGFSASVPTAENAGTYYVWYYAGGNENYNETAISGTSIEVVIDKATITPSVSMSGWTYGEEASSPSVSGNTGNGGVTYQYKESGADDGTYSGTAPTTPGTYTVKATVAETTNYNGNSATVDFTIASGTLTVTANDYSGTYDGVAHGITVTCEGATIKYRTTAEGEYSETNPTYTNVCDAQTVYYQVTKENYTTVEGSKTVTITQKEVTVSGITASNKTYDGNTSATLDCTGATITGKVGSDDLTVTATGTFADANVGSGKTVTISDITLGGSSAANYTLAASGNQTSTTADITAASFTPVVTLSGWTYGSPNSPSVGETNTSGGTVTYYYKTGDAEWTTTQPTDVGTHKVKASIAASGNYAAAESSPVDFTITQKEVTVSGITASNKTYDGNTTATLVYTSVSIDGKVGEDDLTVTATGTFDNANVGSGKTVTISDITLGGSSVANYKLAASGNQTSTTANITAVAASVTTAPAAVTGDLTFSGSAQTLFSAGSVTGGTLKYKVTTSSTKPENTNDFTTTIDQQTNAGTYYLWYYVEGDANHNSTSVNGTGISKSIDKANGAATLSSSSVAFGTSTANQTVTVSGNTGTVSASVTSGSGCTVSVSGTTITITRNSNAAFSATITVTIAESTNYNSTTKAISVSGTAVLRNMTSATSGDIGKVICSNGHIHSNVSDVTCGGSASAMIAYVGNQNNANGNGAYSSTYNHGLAIALADVINTSGNLQTAASHTNYLTWKNAKTACSSFKGSKPSGVTWMLPSAYQWERMLIGCGSTATYVAYSSQSFGSFSYGNFRTKLTSCGNNTQGVYDVQSNYYWSSTENSSVTSGAWYYRFSNSYFGSYDKTTGSYVRACYAF